jgi:N-acyl-D-amino-acid deacylase
MSTEYGLLIRNGLICDGNGRRPVAGDIAANGETIEPETIAAIGQLRGARGRTELDAGGLAVFPGFINMLSWANRSLIKDGRSQSDIRQGVTLEVLGEGSSMEPLNDTMKRQMRDQQGDIKYAIEWTTLDEYLDHLVKRGGA